MKTRLLFFFLFAVGKCLAEFTGKRSYYELRILPTHSFLSVCLVLSTCKNKSNEKMRQMEVLPLSDRLNKNKSLSFLQLFRSLHFFLGENIVFYRYQIENDF